jgi:hypothetical protein
LKNFYTTPTNFNNQKTHPSEKFSSTPKHPRPTSNSGHSKTTTNQSKEQKQTNQQQPLAVNSAVISPIFSQFLPCG